MRRTLLTLAAAAATLLSSAGTAAAGTYVVTSCGAAGGVNSSWTFERSSTAMRATDLCAGGNPGDDDLFTTFTPALGIRTELGQPYPPLGTYGYLRIDAPSPLKLTGIRLSFSSHSESDSWRMTTDSDQGELSHCQSNEPGGGINDSCRAGTRGGTAVGFDFTTQPDPLTPTSWFRIGQRCVLNPCHMGTSAHAAATAIFAAAVWVTDPLAPSATITGVPGEISAGAAVTATAIGSDQTGIRRLELLVDGQVVGATDRACDFKLVLPCASPGGQISQAFTTAGLSAGAHTVASRITDASGNTATSAPATVTAIAPPPPPTPTPTPTPAAPTPTPTLPGATPTPSVPTPAPSPAPPAARKAALLRIQSTSRRGSTVRVRGTLAEGCRSRLKITVKVGGRTRTARITAPRSGRWGVTIRGVRRGGKTSVKVVASSSKVCRPADRSRRV